MSLIRQFWLLIWATLGVFTLGAGGVSLLSARHQMETQMSQKNQERALLVSLWLSRHSGEPAVWARLVNELVIPGTAESIRVTDETGVLLWKFQPPVAVSSAPAWFSRQLTLKPDPGVARVSLEGREAGEVQLEADVAECQQELWESSLELTLLLLGVGGVCSILAFLGVARIRPALDSTVRQARALAGRRLVTKEEPDVPELRDLTRAMNAMVDRLKGMLDEQAGLVDQLRRQANCDTLTGVSNRAHFLARLKGLLGAEDGSATGALILVRVCDLQGINRRLGRNRTDALLRDMVAAVLATASECPAYEVGRLNGSDLALVMPDLEALQEPAVDLAARLRALLRERDSEAVAVVGAVRWWHGAQVSSLLAAADHALARAEDRGPFAVDLNDQSDMSAQGADTWRQRLEAALDGGQCELKEFALVDSHGAVIHRECPLRIGLNEGSEGVPAAQWLPMARRALLTTRIDLMAVGLALKAIESDGVHRSINLCAGSLIDPQLLPQLRGVMDSHRSAAARLNLEVTELGAQSQRVLMRELVGLCRIYGTQLGLEHAGEHLSEALVLLEAGLDFVKLDASFTEGLATDDIRQQHVASTIRLLHGMGVKAYAEGVGDLEDAKALWACGLDGLTGPVVAA